MKLISIRHDPFNIVKSFILKGERAVLVDMGPPGGEAQVAGAMAAEGIAADAVSLMVVTHVHPDHVGGTAALKRQTGAPIALDHSEVHFAAGDERARATPTGIVGRLFRLTPLPHEAFEFFTPDVFVSHDMDLAPYGVEATLIRCGGHTPGSLSIHLPKTGEVLAGDLLAGGIGIGGFAWHGRVIEPPFHEDRAAVLHAVWKLLDFPGLRTIHVCHGGPLSPAKVERWAKRMSKNLQQTRGLS